MDFLAQLLLRVWFIVLGDVAVFYPLDKCLRIVGFFDDGRGPEKIIKIAGSIQFYWQIIFLL